MLLNQFFWNYQNLQNLKINQKHKNVIPNPTLHIVLIKVNKAIDICNYIVKYRV